jgi:homospermidine synthase
MELCRELNVFYIDTVIEPWKGFYSNPKISAPDRTNYAMREKMLVAKRKRKPGSITSITCCGANPGMVSWFVKQALVNVATDLGLKFKEPKTREEWAALMQKAGVKGIHIAERDTQVRNEPKPPHTFVNTWSIEGFVSEGCTPSDMKPSTDQVLTKTSGSFGFLARWVSRSAM